MRKTEKLGKNESLKNLLNVSTGHQSQSNLKSIIYYEFNGLKDKKKLSKNKSPLLASQPKK